MTLSPQEFLSTLKNAETTNEVDQLFADLNLNTSADERKAIYDLLDTYFAEGGTDMSAADRRDARENLGALIKSPSAEKALEYAQVMGQAAYYIHNEKKDQSAPFNKLFMAKLSNMPDEDYNSLEKWMLMMLDAADEFTGISSKTDVKTTFKKNPLRNRI